MSHIKTCLKAKAERTKERKKLKEEKAAAAAAKDKDGSIAEKREISVDSPEEIRKKPGAKKMAKKEGDGAKGKKRKADGWAPHRVDVWSNAMLTLRRCQAAKRTKGQKEEREARETGSEA